MICASVSCMCIGKRYWMPRDCIVPRIAAPGVDSHLGCHKCWPCAFVMGTCERFIRVRSPQIKICERCLPLRREQDNSGSNAVEASTKINQSRANCAAVHVHGTGRLPLQRSSPCHSFKHHRNRLGQGMPSPPKHSYHLLLHLMP